MLAIGTSDGIVMLESKNAAWEVAERALPGAPGRGAYAAPEAAPSSLPTRVIFESSDSTGGGVRRWTAWTRAPWQ